VHDLAQLLLAHLRGMWHRRWFGLAAAWIAAVIGVAIAMRIPERYEASARLYVDTQSLLRPLMAGISIQPNLDQQVVLMSRTLISRPNVEKLVRMADLDLTVNSASGEDVVDSVTKRLQLVGNPSANLYTISFRDPQPELARKVVQSLVTIFVESSLGDKREDTVNAVKFIDDQIKRYEAGLKAAEERLKAFRLKYLGVTNVSNQNYFTRLSTLNDQIEATRLQLRAAEESRDSYKRELVGEAPVLLPEVGAPAAAAPGGSVPSIDARLAVLKTDLDTLRRRFTDDHPDIVGNKRVIAQLEEQRAQEVEALNKAAAAAGSNQSAEPSANRNPVFQQLRVALATSEANVASLRATLASYEAQSARLIRSARLVPEVDAEFAQLNRDYDIQKKTYEALLARRESAALGEGVADAGGTRFKVIDPPRVSPQPVFPNRMVLLAIAFAGALLIGVAASFAASELMPTFHNARSLGVVTKRPVVGMVTMFPSQAVRRMRRLSGILFAGASSAFVVSFAALFAFVLLLGRVV
jgi:polysaccharide chain length determinant protein (PEP-CTERM system associated)